MLKRLVRQGNSWAVVIEKSLLKALKMEQEAPLKMHSDGKALLITRARVSGVQKGLKSFKIKRLTRHGHSAAIVIEKPLLKILDIAQGDTLELTIEDKILRIAPARVNKQFDKSKPASRYTAKQYPEN